MIVGQPAETDDPFVERDAPPYHFQQMAAGQGLDQAGAAAETRDLDVQLNVDCVVSLSHFEIGCRETAKTQEFYAKLFDWNITAMGPASVPEPPAMTIRSPSAEVVRLSEWGCTNLWY